MHGRSMVMLNTVFIHVLYSFWAGFSAYNSLEQFDQTKGHLNIGFSHHLSTFEDHYLNPFDAVTASRRNLNWSHCLINF